MYRERGALIRHFTQSLAPQPDEYKAIMGESPTLAVMNSTFGKGTAEIIIAQKLCSLNQYTNARVKITPEQADELATILVADPELRGIKAEVLCMFFDRLKAGAFGELYNIVDAVSIAAKLRQFYQKCETKRIAWADSKEMEETYRRLDEHRKNAMTAEQFKKTEAYKRLIQEQQ
jgi:hypothetical protein